MLTCADDVAAAARSNLMNESAQIPPAEEAAVEEMPREEITENSEMNEIVVAAPPPGLSSGFAAYPLIWSLSLLFSLLNCF
jgi:hypothetical protein